ncbi:MAG: GNAT family protein [Pseudomonadota bacterium]
MRPFPVLETERLRLRQPASADVAELTALTNDFAVFDTTGNLPYPYRKADAIELVERAETHWAEQTALHAIVADRDSGAVRGYALLRFDAGFNTAELGYWIGTAFAGRGLATEAAAAVVDYGFGTLAMCRLEAQYLSRNSESGRVLEKLGFKQEGLLREASYKHGYGEDLIVAGLLRHEWLDRLR